MNPTARFPCARHRRQLAGKHPCSPRPPGLGNDVRQHVRAGHDNGNDLGDRAFGQAEGQQQGRNERYHGHSELTGSQLVFSVNHADCQRLHLQPHFADLGIASTGLAGAKFHIKAGRLVINSHGANTGGVFDVESMRSVVYIQRFCCICGKI